MLTSRLIDRPIRPLFPSGWRYETQIVALLISADTENDSDVLAITGASAALALSSIPFEKTIAGVRVGLVDGAVRHQPDLSPSASKSKIDLVVAGSADAIMMVEAGAKEATEEEMIGALDAAHKAIKQIVAAIDDLQARASARPRRRSRPRRSTTAFHREVEDEGLRAARRGDAHQGQARELRRASTRCSASSSRRFPKTEAERRADAKTIFKDLKEKVMRDEILERGQRLDGRRFDEIRPIWIETGVLPRVHGSAVFTRGETQALVTATLGTEDDAQKIETVEGETYKRFMLHYNFPPFSVGEVQFLRGPGRREVGHGALAERALVPLLPTEERLPLHRPHRLRHPRVERLVVDGVGLRRRAGADGRGRAAQGAGRRRGDGPRDGREDRQVGGALRHRGRRGPLRRHGLQGRRHAQRASPRCRWTSRSAASRWTSCARRSSRRARAASRSSTRWPAALAERRARTSPSFAPRIVTIRIPTEKIRDVIGPGGKTIRSIIEKTGVKIDVEDDGRVNVASADEGAAAKAIAMIQELTATPELDKTYMGRVERITDFGAFIEIMPGVDGLLHVSEIANYRVKDVRDELKEGEQIMVKVINVDPSGKVRLSRKALLAPDEGTAPRDPRPVHDGPPDGGPATAAARPGPRRPRSRARGPRRH